MIEIQKTNRDPIYKQIVNQVIEMIQESQIKPEEKLPPERDLAKALGVSRGTIKKAYEYLVMNQFAYSAQGSGTYVSSDFPKSDPNPLSGGENVERLIDTLKQKGFSNEEIKLLVDIKLMNRLDGGDKLNIAAIDCNPEALSMINRKFSSLSQANVKDFLLEDVLNYQFAGEIFEDFDIIFTTTTHYQDLIEKLSFARGKIVQSAMTAHRDTMNKVAAIPDMTKVGVLTKTKRFGEIVSTNLKKIGVELGEDSYLTTENLSLEKCVDFMKNKKYLIMPPLFTMDLNLAIGNRILQFGHSDGEIITFNYTIERGVSYLYQRTNVKS